MANYLKYIDLSNTKHQICGTIDYEKKKIIFLLHRLVSLSYIRYFLLYSREEKREEKESFKRASRREIVLALL